MRKAEQGLSLVEMLVALAVLAMAASLLLAGVVTAGVTARQGRAEERASAEVATAQAILRNRIERIRPVRRLDSSDGYINIVGNDRLFDFYGPPPDADSGNGVQRYRLMLTAPGDLVLYRSPELTTEVQLAESSVVGWQATTLLHHVASLSIAYFGPNRDDPVPRWRVFWRDTGTLPRVVRIRVGFGNGDPRAWPELIARPAATIDMTCETGQARACGGKT